MAEHNFIEIRGAREHNLKNIDISIPKNRLTVITGLSGSGKSSLAFDTVYAEGQRRYVESLSSYARQFLELMKKPDVDSIEGLSPAISIEQKTTSHNPRSTVGTVTEIYDYMRLLWARAGTPYSPATGLPIESQTVSQMVDRIAALPEGSRILLLAPIARGKKGEFKKEFENLQRQGYQRLKIDLCHLIFHRIIIYFLNQNIVALPVCLQRQPAPPVAGFQQTFHVTGAHFQRDRTFDFPAEHIACHIAFSSESLCLYAHVPFFSF